MGYWAGVSGLGYSCGMTQKILVVEDDKTLQETLAYNLERQGYEVVVTADGRLSAQYEHTIAMTPNGPEILTKL